MSKDFKPADVCTLKEANAIRCIRTAEFKVRAYQDLRNLKGDQDLNKVLSLLEEAEVVLKRVYRDHAE